VGRLAIAGRRAVQKRRCDSPSGPGRVEPVGLDVTQPATIAQAAQAIAGIVSADGLSGLVNMAGIIVEGPLEAIPPESSLTSPVDGMIRDPFKHIAQIRFRIYSNEFATANETVHGCSPLSSGIRSREQITASAESHITQRSLGCIIAHLGAAVRAVARQCGPVLRFYGVADRPGKR
jgi:hypothetical protein